ncbi:unnamed protein product, partial [Prorocentrum cordatum]
GDGALHGEPCLSGPRRGGNRARRSEPAGQSLTSKGPRGIDGGGRKSSSPSRKSCRSCAPPRGSGRPRGSSSTAGTSSAPGAQPAAAPIRAPVELRVEVLELGPQPSALGVLLRRGGLGLCLL